MLRISSKPFSLISYSRNNASYVLSKLQSDKTFNNFSTEPRPTNIFPTFSDSSCRPDLNNKTRIAQLYTSACLRNDLPQTILAEHKKGVVRTSVKIERKPFIKGLFKGEFEKDVLSFPEVMNYEELISVKNMLDSTRNFTNENVNSIEIDRDSKISTDLIESMKSLGLFGLTAPVEFGGLDLKRTECLWIMDTMGTDSSLGLTLISYQSLIEQLAPLLNKDQKEKYLRKLSTGELKAAFCFSEFESGSDPAMIQTNASLTDNNSYVLNGVKNWVTNGQFADILIVFAKINQLDYAGETEFTLGAFIVDKNTPGVVVSKPFNKLGVKGTNSVSIEFKNVELAKENLIKDVNSGHQFSLNVMEKNRLSESALILGLLKELIDYTVSYCINKSQFGKPLMDFELIQNKIAIMVEKTYTTESMLYLTAGLEDSTQNPDVLLESIITKIYASESLLHCIYESMQIFGAKSLLVDDKNHLERIYRDARSFTLTDGSNDLQRLFVALIGVKGTGQSIAGDIEKLRNPLFHPKFALMKMIDQERAKKNRIKLTLDLVGYLHETFHVEADFLEIGVKRLYFALQSVLIRNGSEVVQKQIELKRICDIVTLIYGMTANLSRASRSYCIGLPYSTVENNLTRGMCHKAYVEIIKMADDLENGPIGISDEVRLGVAKEIFNNKGYVFVNPASRNY